MACSTTDSGEVLYANAGHNPPYILRDGGRGRDLIGSGAMALGIIEDMPYGTLRIRLAPGENSGLLQ